MPGLSVPRRTAIRRGPLRCGPRGQLCQRRWERNRGSESAGINRLGVGNERVLRERPSQSSRPRTVRCGCYHPGCSIGQRHRKAGLAQRATGSEIISPVCRHCEPREPHALVGRCQSIIPILRVLRFLRRLPVRPRSPTVAMCHCWPGNSLGAAAPSHWPKSNRTVA